MENGDDWLAPDKFQHILLCFSLNLIFSILAALSRHSFLRRHSIFIGSIISLSAGAAKEIADEFGFFRSAGASAKDAVADLVGILIAVFALRFSKPLFNRVSPDQNKGLEIVRLFNSAFRESWIPAQLFYRSLWTYYWKIQGWHRRITF